MTTQAYNAKKCERKFAGKRSHDHIRHARMWIGCSRFQVHDVTGETKILVRGCKLKLIRQAWFILHCLQYIVCHSGYFRILQPWQHFFLIISLFPIISYTSFTLLMIVNYLNIPSWNYFDFDNILWVWRCLRFGCGKIVFSLHTSCWDHKAKLYGNSYWDYDRPLLCACLLPLG